MDLNYTRDTTSGREGLELMDRLRAVDDSLPLVVMTAWASVDVAVEAMRRGARDFVEKPWDNARLLAILRNQIDLHRALRRGQRLEAENELLRAGGRAGPDRPLARDAAGARPDRARRALGGERADHRRERHRQGGGGARAPRRLRAAPASRW